MKRLTSFALLLVLISEPLFAQSASEIEAARSLARSYGYSDADISKAAGNLASGDKARGVTDKTTTDYSVRNTSTYTTIPSRQYVPVDEVTAIENGGVMLNTPKGRKNKVSDIYGHGFFISDGLSYLPGFNVPAPESYTLGPGDELEIDIWGSANTSFSRKVASDGSVNIDGVGPLYVAGLTLAKAEKSIKSRLSNVYSGLSDGSAHVSVSIGHLRGVSVYVLGEVATPGVYTLSSLSSLATAIYVAGGVKKVSSVRDIRLYRGGKLLATFDLYDFIFYGKYDSNMRLQDGDIISVRSLGPVVEIGGGVVRSYKFEIKPGETLDRLIKYAGSFNDFADCSSVHVDRVKDGKGESFDVDSSDFASFPVYGGDKVYVREFRSRYDSSVAVVGAVLYEGGYSLSDSLRTVRQLVKAAGGLDEGAYTGFAYIRRLDDDRLPSSISFNLQDVLDGRKDVLLRGNDTLTVCYNDELKEKSTISVDGAVNAPGTFDYRDGMTLGEALLLSKGCTDGANLEIVEIAGRGMEERGTVRRYDVRNHPETLSTVLSPYDIVFVRKYTHYREQQKITINGEVCYPGTYVIDKSEVRLSDVVQRAGGFTEEAFISGGKLTRTLNQMEYERLLSALEVAKQQKGIKDTTIFNIGADAVGDSFVIAIDLEAAMHKPGSFADVVLRNGDIIEVPQLNNTVKVSGAVYFPNTIVYDRSFTLKDYLDRAGGCLKGARRSKIYAVYMNGFAVSRKSPDFKLEPGMEIVVPQKQVEEHHRMTAGEIAALASTTTSVASLIAVLINALVK